MDIQEIEKLIDQKIEKAKEDILLALPEVWSSLALEQKSQLELAEKFYTDHPEFKNHKEIVAHMISLEDGKNPLAGMKEKLGKAVPKIKRRIEETKGLSMSVNDNPSLKYEPIPSPSGSNNGEI